MSTGRNIKRNYLAGRLETIPNGKPRPGAEPGFTGETRAQLIMLACGEPPAGHARWTLRPLAERLIALEYVETISHVTVGARITKPSGVRSLLQ